MSNSKAQNLGEDKEWIHLGFRERFLTISYKVSNHWFVFIKFLSSAIPDINSMDIITYNMYSNAYLVEYTGHPNVLDMAFDLLSVFLFLNFIMFGLTY